MRRILQIVAACLGSMGILAVWGSSRWPDCGFDAILMLSTATFITLGMPQPATARRRRQRSRHHRRIKLKFSLRKRASS
jgi:hypothetical protein